MTHLDSDLLSLLALGEDAATPDETAHLVGCGRCEAELRALRRAVAAGREVDGTGLLEEPDPRVWAAIVQDLGLTAVAATDPGPRTTATAVRHRPIRRRRRFAVLAAIAAATVLLVGGIGTMLIRTSTDPIASARLVAFPDWRGQRGTAVLEVRPDGEQVVDVRTTLRPDGSTDHEVWLMTAGAQRLVSLGTLSGTTGRFVVPAGVDVHRYRYVDVSDEPRDGDTAHSGDSIIRGALRF